MLSGLYKCQVRILDLFQGQKEPEKSSGHFLSCLVRADLFSLVEFCISKGKVSISFPTVNLKTLLRRNFLRQ